MNLKISIVLCVCERENGNRIYHLTQDLCSVHQKTHLYRISSLNINLSFGWLIYCSIPLCTVGLWGNYPVHFVVDAGIRDNKVSFGFECVAGLAWLYKGYGSNSCDAWSSRSSQLLLVGSDHDTLTSILKYILLFHPFAQF